MGMIADTVSVADLSTDPHPILHRLRSQAPVSWIPALDAWLVTSHELSVQVMLDAVTFTVDDPRFSTQQVIGPSMLSLDGPEHRRHRDPFGGPFRAAKVRELQDYADRTARRLVSDLAAGGSGDLRAEVAGPLAVEVMTKILDLHDVEVADVLTWYRQIVDAVHVVTEGGQVPESGHEAFAALKSAVTRTSSASSLLDSVGETGTLTIDEIASNVAVLLFGGIVTSESSSAIAFRFLLDDASLMSALQDDRSLIRPFVEETFRLEPSAAAVDRYATADVELGEKEISAGDLVRVSLSAANRDAVVFADPDGFDMDRDFGRSVTFARGPHACLGIHLARLEAIAAVNALVGRPGAVARRLDPITGLVFRAPERVVANWPGDDSSLR
jgi:cytochrome P450